MVTGNIENFKGQKFVYL